jgi:hypothetical protein
LVVTGKSGGCQALLDSRVKCLKVVCYVFRFKPSSDFGRIVSERKTIKLQSWSLLDIIPWVSTPSETGIQY